MNGVPATDEPTEGYKRQPHHAVPASTVLSQHLFARTAAAMLIIDAVTGAVLDANPAACAVYGYQHAEVLRLNLRQIACPESASQILAAGNMPGFQSAWLRVQQPTADAAGAVDVCATAMKWNGQAALLLMLHDGTAHGYAEDQPHDQAHHLAALHEATVALLTSRSVADLLEPVLHHAARLVGTAHGSICVLNEQAEPLARYTQLGEPEHLELQPLVCGEGVMGYVWHHRRPLMIENYQTWPHRRDLRLVNIFAVIGIPLIVDEDLIGVLALIHTTPDRHFSAIDLQVLTQFGSVVSLALAKARHYTLAQQELAERHSIEHALRHANAHLQRQTSVLEALHQTALTLINRLDPQELLQPLIERAAALLQTSNGFIFLHDPQADMMVLSLSIGQSFYRTKVQRGEGLVGQVWQRQHTINVVDYQHWPQRLPDDGLDMFHAVIAVPLYAGSQVVGVLGLRSTDSQVTFSDDQAVLLEQFAHLASLALANARLYTEAQRELAERRQVEQELRRANERFTLAAAAVNSAIYDWDIVTDRLMWTDGMTTVFGHLPNAIEDSLDWWEAMLHPADRATAMDVLTGALKHETSYFCAYRFRTGAGAYRDVWDRGYIVRDATGTATRMIGSMSDVTQQMAVQGALREREEQYRTLVELSPDAIAVYQQGRLAYINPAGLRLVGATTPGEIMESAPNTFVNRAALRNLTLATDQSPIGFTVRHCAGHSIEVEAVAHPITYQGAPATQWIVRDVTERKQAEQRRLALERKLLETQKLESLGVLAGGIAHDFNNLLVAMLGNAELALLDVDPTHPAAETIQHIQTAAQRAADLTRQLLAYSGRGHFEIQPIDLNELVQEMIHLLRVSITRYTSLHYSFTPNLPAIQADATQIRQVIMNLVVNASEAIEAPPGAISITTGVQWVDQAYLADTYPADPLPDGRYVYLAVADTGCGITAETQAKMFEPFFSTKFTGRGLGLAAVLGIVRGHHGALHIHSAPGQGTTMTLLLPGNDQPPHDAAASAQPETRDHQQGLILVIDDEVDVCRVTGRILQRLGWEVLTANTGETGVALFAQQPERLTCVLVDMTMPRMDGLMTFQAIRDIRPDVPVLLMSGYSEQDAITRFAGQGLAGFLSKPFTITELRVKLNEILGSASAS